MKKFILATLIAASAISAGAVPAKRGPYRAFNADGTEITVCRIGDENGSWFLDMQGNLLMSTERGFEYARIDSDGTLRKADAPVKFSRSMLPANSSVLPGGMRTAPAIGRFPGTAFPSTGKQKALVVLVEFQDTKFHLGDKAHQYFTDMLNKEGFNEYNGTGCAHEYFLEMSSGQFDCDFDLYGPVTLKNDYKYYGKNASNGAIDPNAYKMAVEACDALDATVDFSEYDRDNDGYIDNIFIFYAGEGEATAYPDNANLVWPHAYDVSYYGRWEYDGKRLGSYGCTNEWQKIYASTGWGKVELVDEYPDGVGTFVHEFSHILGLPDLYLTDESEMTSSDQGYFTPGEWSVLDYGPYNNDGRTPPAYSAFERNALGWMTLEELTGETGTGSLTHIEESNHAYSITNPKKSTEFYLLESRKRSGWDTYIPADGMLVWHIDYDAYRWEQNTVNNKSSHQYVDLVEADGKSEKMYRNGGDCFPGTAKKTELATTWWDKTSTGLKLSEITLTADKGVTFTVTGPAPSVDPDDPVNEWYSVAQVIDAPMNDQEAAVRGYIVGFVKSGTFNERGVVFGTEDAVMTNLVLADAPDETNLDSCIPIQLVKNSAARSELNLADNPSMLGKQVEVYGTLSTYMSKPAVKNVETYTLLSTEPDPVDPVEPDDPVNPVNPDDPDESSIVEVGADCSDAPLFDLQGRRVLAPQSGRLYIRSGKVIRY